MQLRRQFIKSWCPPVLTISIGNITAGGTGKTPTTMLIARLLYDKGYQVGVSHRGYKGIFEKEIKLISNTKEIFPEARLAGDEAFLLAEKLPGIPVVVGKERQAAIRLLKKEFPALDYVILDDSFQHLAVAHDFDFLVFNSMGGGVGNGFIFPAGILRESLSACNYASAIIINGDTVPEALTVFKKPIFMCEYQLTGVLVDNRIMDKEELISRQLGLLSGIGLPASYEKTMSNYGLTWEHHYVLPDHYAYNGVGFLAGLASDMQVRGIDMLICTEKDYAKLRFLAPDFVLGVAQTTYSTMDVQALGDLITSK